MAANTPDTEAIEFGEHLTRLREVDGNPSFGVMARTILVNTGISIVDQTLGNYHAGRTNPRKVRREVLKAIVRFYGCTPSDLGPVAAAELAALSDLTASDEVFARSGCSSQTAALASVA